MSIELNIDCNKIPDKEWKWNESSEGYTGVKVNGGKLIWFIKKHNNTTPKETTQSFDDYMKEGPLYDTIPAEVMVDLYELIIDAVK